MTHNNIIISSFYLFASLSVLTKLVLNFINIRHIASHRELLPEKFAKKMTLQEHHKAADYTIAKLKFSNKTILIHFLFLLAWIPAGGLQIIEKFALTFKLDEIGTGLIFYALFFLINLILELPENLYRTFFLEEKFDFNKTTYKIFIIDMVKQIILAAAIGLPLFYVLFKMILTLGETWWVYAWAFIVIFQFLLLWAYPKFIAPLFNKFQKLEDENLIKKIDLLIESCGLTFRDYYVMNASLRSAHGNAYFTGFGRNKRIVFFDTLLTSLEEDEVTAVLAHELGHLKHKHIFKSLLWNILFMGLGLYFLGILYENKELFLALAKVEKSSYMGIMLFSFIIPAFTYFLTPVTSWLSRRKEYEADRFAAHYAQADDLISALVKMYKDNSSTLTPSPYYAHFYYSHPPAIERIEFLESLLNENSSVD